MLGNNLVGGWVSCSLFPKYAIPIHEKLFAVRGKKKVAQMPLFSPIFLGLGWPWVFGEFGRFHNNIDLFFRPDRIGESQTS